MSLFCSFILLLDVSASSAVVCCVHSWNQFLSYHHHHRQITRASIECDERGHFGNARCALVESDTLIKGCRPRGVEVQPHGASSILAAVLNGFSSGVIYYHQFTGGSELPSELGSACPVYNLCFRSIDRSSKKSTR